VTDLSLVIRPERPEDAPAIERLHARAFGPGRFARTAYRLREGAAERIDLGITASVGSFLVGSVRMGPVRTGATPFVMLGPLAVDPSFEGRGIGGTLTRAAIDGARLAGEGLVILRLHAGPARAPDAAGAGRPGAPAVAGTGRRFRRRRVGRRGGARPDAVTETVPRRRRARSRQARRSASAAIRPAASRASATGVAEVAGHAEAATVNSAPKVICVKP